MSKFLVIAIFLICCQCYSQNKQDVFQVAKSGALGSAKELIAENENAFRVTDNRGFSPLILAAYSGNNEVATFIMPYSDVNLLTTMGTALMASVVKGNVELTRHLLQNKVNTDLADANGTTALMYAVQFKNKEMVELLIKHNADKSLIDRKGRTAFEMAVMNSDELIINLLK